MPTGTKHLVKCRCILPQFKQLQNPPQHQFTVFSVIEDDDSVKPSFAQCNNCGIVHKIVDVGRSEIISGKESMSSLITIDDLKHSLPENLVALLEKNSADLPTWQYASFIIENKMWGNFVVVSSELESDVMIIKYVQILGENLFKVQTASREEYVK